MNATVIRTYGAIIVSVFNSVIFLGLVVAVYFVNDAQLRGTLMNLLVGSAITNFTTVVNYFVGSSAGSAQKDEKLEPPPPKP